MHRFAGKDQACIPPITEEMESHPRAGTGWDDEIVDAPYPVQVAYLAFAAKGLSTH